MTNTQTLRVSNINLAISASNNQSLGAEDAIGQIDNALQTLLSQQANLGAIVVRLNEDQDSANTAATNLQASESNIRDLNVGSATTQFTRLQILVRVGTAVLSQSNANVRIKRRFEKRRERALQHSDTCLDRVEIGAHA